MSVNKDGVNRPPTSCGASGALTAQAREQQMLMVSSWASLGVGLPAGTRPNPRAHVYQRRVDLAWRAGCLRPPGRSALESHEGGKQLLFKDAASLLDGLLNA